MPSGAERIALYDRDDQLVDYVNLPAHYMEGAEVRSICVLGKTFVEGGRADSFYGKGQFAEVVKK